MKLRQQVSGGLGARVAIVGLAATGASTIVALALSLRRHKARLARAHRQLLADPLTGLANRKKLLLDLEAAMGGSEEHVLVFYDLNGFKHFNDSFGHPSGDVLLRRLAERLRAAVGEAGCAYRLGGDEFCVLVASRSHGLEELVQATQAALTEEGHGFQVSSSFGVARVPTEARDVSSALTVADRRLYENKRAKQAGVEPFPNLIGRVPTFEALE